MVTRLHLLPLEAYRQVQTLEQVVQGRQHMLRHMTCPDAKHEMHEAFDSAELALLQSEVSVVAKPVPKHAVVRHSAELALLH